MQITPLNTCRLDWEENYSGIYVDSVVLKIKILINTN